MTDSLLKCVSNKINYIHNLLEIIPSEINDYTQNIKIF